ncbi:hypothetical protein N9M74_01910 [Pontimonas sp.]|nr:hypothetical protein [Pontimonas sp.]
MASALRSMSELRQKIAVAWTRFVLRNDFVFPAYGGLYVRSAGHTLRLRALITSKWSHAGQGVAYRRIGFGPGISSNDRRTSVLIHRIGRLGNSVIQATNAAHLAELIGSNSIHYRRFDAINQRTVLFENGVSLSRLPLIVPAQKPPGTIWRTDAIYRGGLLFEACSPMACMVGTTLGRFILGPAVPREAPLGVLTVHVRSGDLFGANPHRGYGQPPLSFYTKVLAYKSWTEVVVVAEDCHNPCVLGIEEWCKVNNVPVSLVLGDIHDALSNISNATSLAAANGSFSPAATFLANKAREIFFFGENPHPLFCKDRCTIYQISDIDGRYQSLVLDNNWQNSESQRELMVLYPEESLSKPMAISNEIRPQ